MSYKSLETDFLHEPGFVEARSSVFDEKEGDSVSRGFGFSIGHCHHHHQISQPAVGYPHFGAVQYEIRPISPSVRFDALEITSHWENSIECQHFFNPQQSTIAFRGIKFH